MRKICLAALFAVAIVGCSGKEPVTGMWKGKITVPDNLKNDPRAQNLPSPVLELKDDKTFTLSSIGPGGNMTGTYTESEAQISLTTKTIGGQPIDNFKAVLGDKIKELENMPVQVSADGKKLTMSASSGMQGAIEFTR